MILHFIKNVVFEYELLKSRFKRWREYESRNNIK